MSETKPLLKLRATLSIDIDAKDYIHAASIQGDIEKLCEDLKTKYVGCSYDIRERRDRGEAPPAPKPTKQKRARTRKPAQNTVPSDTEPEQEAAHMDA